jgi:hypothetical protein
MPKYKCVGCGNIHNDNDYSKKDGDILVMKTLSDKEWNTTISGHKGTKYHKGYLKEDTKEKVQNVQRRLKDWISKLETHLRTAKPGLIKDLNKTRESIKIILEEEFGKGLMKK